MTGRPPGRVPRSSLCAPHPLPALLHPGAQGAGLYGSRGPRALWLPLGPANGAVATDQGGEASEARSPFLWLPPCRGPPGWQGPATKGHCCAVTASCIGCPPGGWIVPSPRPLSFGWKQLHCFQPRVTSSHPLCSHLGEYSLFANNCSPKHRISIVSRWSPGYETTGPGRELGELGGDSAPTCWGSVWLVYRWA